MYHEGLTEGLRALAETFDYNRCHYAIFTVRARLVEQMSDLTEKLHQELADLGVPDRQGLSLKASSEPSAIDFVSDLTRWLDCTVENVAQIAHVSRSAIFYWRRTGARPRPEALRSLLRVHSLVGSLVRQFEPRGAQAWLRSDSPTSWALLVDGDVATVEDRFRGTLMSQPGRRDRYARLLAESSNDTGLDLSPVESRPPRRANRRSKRGSPQGRD